ncbi:MAG: hypothetical protein WCP16_19275 [Pseudanabaena sp. ELA645]
MADNSNWFKRVQSSIIFIAGWRSLRSLMVYKQGRGLRFLDAIDGRANVSRSDCWL